jgi:hypothetical protein
MRGAPFPKVYRSFEEFERDELRKFNGFHASLDEMIDDMFGSELEKEKEKAKRGRKAKGASVSVLGDDDDED